MSPGEWALYIMEDEVYLDTIAMFCSEEDAWGKYSTTKYEQ